MSKPLPETQLGAPQHPISHNFWSAVSCQVLSFLNRRAFEPQNPTATQFPLVKPPWPQPDLLEAEGLWIFLSGGQLLPVG